jgi:hypothetical protein
MWSAICDIRYGDGNGKYRKDRGEGGKGDGPSLTSMAMETQQTYACVFQTGNLT